MVSQVAAAIIADAEEAVAGSTATGAVMDVGGLLGMTWLVTVTAAGALVAMLAPVGTMGATTPLAKLGAGEAKHTNVSTCNDTRAANKYPGKLLRRVEVSKCGVL